MPTRLYRITADVTFAAPVRRHAQRSRSQRRASGRGTSDDGRRGARTRLHARRAHDRARADGGDRRAAVRLAVARARGPGTAARRRCSRFPTLRTTQTYLRAQIAAQYPQRLWKIDRAAAPVRRRTRRNPLCGGASLARRGGRRLLFSPRRRAQRRPIAARAGARRFPTSTHCRSPNSATRRALGASPRASPSCGSPTSAATPDAADTEAPTWRDRWDDKQRLPLLVRIDVKPEKGAAWPTLVVEPRRSPAGGMPSCRTHGRNGSASRTGRCATRSRPSDSAQRGIALIAVLWLTVLLTVIASGFAFSMRGGALAARNTMSVAQARAAADGAVERVAFELSRPRNSPDVWLADGRARATWTDGEIAITATTRSTRSALNRHQPRRRSAAQGTARKCRRTRSDTAERVLEAILDWRDADELRRPNGAEADDYRAAGLKYVPTNARFESNRRTAARDGRHARAHVADRGQHHHLFAATRDQSGDGRPGCRCSRCRA